MTASLFAYVIARFTPKPLRPLAYRYLHVRLADRMRLDPEMVRGKRVLILGAASTVEDDLAAFSSDDHDIVVRMNNGLDTPIRALGPDSLRCDILFHSLTHDCRTVDAEKLATAGVRLLVHRTPKRSSFLATVVAERRFRPIPVRVIPLDRYRALEAALDGHAPTTGMVCLDFFLNAPVAALTIVGFTFFTTKYVDGYDDAVVSDVAAVARVREAGHHDPRREAILLGRWLSGSACSQAKVRLGASVMRALREVTDA